MSNATILPAAQAIFQNQLLIALQKNVSGVNPEVILALGATSDGLDRFSGHVLDAIKASYVTALRYTFSLGIPVAGIAFVVSLFMPWFRYHAPEVKQKGKSLESTTEGSTEKSKQWLFRHTSSEAKVRTEAGMELEAV